MLGYIKTFIGSSAARFVVSGLFNTGVTYAFYWSLLAAGVHFNLALAAAYVLGIALGFVLNQTWTFRSTPQRSAYLRFLATTLVMFLLNLMLLNLLVRLGFASPQWAQIFALGAVTLVSYVLQRYWVFGAAR